MKYYKLLIFILLSASCNSQESLIKKCVTNKINNSIIYKVDGNKNAFFYDAFNEIESYLFLNFTRIKDVNKENYFDMVKHLEINLYDNPVRVKKIKNKLDSVLVKNNLLPTSIYGNISNLTINCYLKKSETSSGVKFIALNKDLKNNIDTLQKLFANGSLFYDSKSILNIINSINDKQFKKLTFRVPIILIIYENITFVSNR